MNDGRASRHRLLDAAEARGATDPHAPEAACPCCNEPQPAPPSAEAPCTICGYPANSAAWVQYDGCA